MSKVLDVQCEDCTDPVDFSFSLGRDYSACSEHSRCDRGFGSNLQSLLKSGINKIYISTCTPCAPGTYMDESDHFDPCKIDGVDTCEAGKRL